MHRKLLELELSDTKFYENSHQFLTIRVQYSLRNATKMSYVLNLSHHRTVELNFKIFSIPKGVMKISCYGKEFKMVLKNMFVGRRVAPIQAFWLYNNTKNLIKYEVEVREILALCQADGFQVMECLNPVGAITPYTALAVLIRFHPIEIKKYELTTSLHFGNKIYPFIINGEGILEENKEMYFNKMLPTSTFLQNFPISLSTESINIDCMLIWSVTERMIFISNVTKDQIIQYAWGSCGIDDLIEVHTVTDSCILQPKESHSIIIKIKTFGESCVSGTLLLPCKIWDYGKLLLHKHTLEKHCNRQAQIDQEYTITEKGTFRKENDIELIPMPKVQIVTLSINVNVVHTKDSDTCMTTEDYLHQNPQRHVDIDVSNVLEEKKPIKNVMIPEEYGKIFCRLVEEIIGEVVFSDVFKESLKISINQPPYYYTQCLTDERKFIRENHHVKSTQENTGISKIRAREIKDLLNQPKLPDLSKTLKRIILHAVHETFKIGTHNPNLAEMESKIQNLLGICEEENCDCKNK